MIPSRAGEYERARRDAAYAAMPWRAVLSVTGPDAETFLQGMLTQDLRGMAPGEVRRACLVDRRAHLIADLWVRRAPEGFEIELPRDCLESVRSTLDRHVIRERLELVALPEAQVILVCGPRARERLEAASLAGGAWSVHETHERPGSDFLLVATDEGVPRELADAGVARITEETLERLRIEAGRPRWGLDLGPESLPMGMGLDEALSTQKGCYLGQETIARVHFRGHVNRRLFGLRVSGEAPARGETVIHRGEPIGRVTSSAGGPSSEHEALALLVAPAAHCVDGESVEIDGRAGLLAELPFREARCG